MNKHFSVFIHNTSVDVSCMQVDSTVKSFLSIIGFHKGLLV